MVRTHAGPIVELQVILLLHYYCYCSYCYYCYYYYCYYFYNYCFSQGCQWHQVQFLSIYHYLSIYLQQEIPQLREPGHDCKCLG